MGVIAGGDLCLERERGREREEKGKTKNYKLKVS